MTHCISRIVLASFLAAAVVARAESPKPAAKPAPGPAPELLGMRMIWDEGPHNAFTDLVRFNDEFYCCFREGAAHVSREGKVRVIKSEAGQRWESVGVIKVPETDLRDPKLVITPRGRLAVYAAAATAKPAGAGTTHQTMVWESKDGWQWGEGKPVGEKDFWLWRVAWHKDTAYGVAYGTQESNKFVRLYSSPDGVSFDTLVPKLAAEGSPNESALVFNEDGTALCLLRRDEGTKTGLLGTSKPTYKEWKWKDLGKQIGGPAMIRLPDGRLIAAVRLYDRAVRTSLCWVDEKNGTLTECLPLPSGGDTSYAGMVLHDGLLWVSYYSSHEGKTSVYLARVKYDGTKPPF
jgi:hypothetical protein